MRSIRISHIFRPPIRVPANVVESPEQIVKLHKERVISEPVHIVELATWDGCLSKRRLRIIHSDLAIDCFGTSSKRKRLYVFLNGGGGRLRDGKNPKFDRVSWHPSIAGMCINIADPTFGAFPGKLRTGWYLGTEGQNAVSSVVAVIVKIQQYYCIGNDAITIIGSSAGGTSALKIASAVPGSTAVAENPPVYPHQRRTAQDFASIGKSLQDGVFRERNRLNFLSTHPNSRFFIIQNIADRSTFRQLKALLGVGDVPDLEAGLSEFGSLRVYLTDVPARHPHHTFMSTSEMNALLAVVEGRVTGSARQGALDAMHESLRTRILVSDQRATAEIWARLIASLDIPALSTPLAPVKKTALRLALRSCPTVYYRLRLSDDAKRIFMAVDVTPETSSAAVAEIEQVATAARVSLVRGANGVTLRVANTPINHAAERLRIFVHSTAHLFS